MKHPIRQLIHGDADIYEGVTPAKTIRQFTDTSLVYHHIRKSRDIELACEVGSWVGYSAYAFCQAFSGHLVCVDTWLGSLEHWIDPFNPRHEMHRKNGQPQIYQEFLQTAAIFPDRITPLPQTSLVAAQLLSAWGVTFDLIYIDGDHSYNGVRADIESYAPLLNDGGVLVGDDYSDPRFEVARAVKDSLGDVEVLVDNFWIWQK